MREVDYLVGRVFHIKVLRWSELDVMGCWERSSQKDNWRGVRIVGLVKGNSRGIGMGGGGGGSLCRDL